MKKYLILAALCPLLTGCWATRIVTVTPDYHRPTTYTTTVTVPRTHTTTTSTRVIATSEDICLSLDLQAVGAAFAQASNVQEFENLLNDSSYMLSNLDLNGDGYVDYLRVLETVDGHNHVFLIQAVLGENVYQDVASVVAELPSVSTAYVQVVGAPYIYGPNYIIRPVFLTTPRIYSYLMRPSYIPWHSPWYWAHYPSCYRRPAPLYLTHYQAYIHTYMNNHRYCHEVHYDNSCHYTQYNIININIQRNDYGRQHPERSFETRNSAVINKRIAAGSSTSATRTVSVNAKDIIESHNAETKTTATTVKPAAKPATSTTVTKPATVKPAAKPATSTTVNSRVRASGASKTKISTKSTTTNKVTTVKRGATTATKAATATMTTTPTKAATATRTTAPTKAATATRATTAKKTTTATRTVTPAKPAKASSATRSTSSTRTARTVQR